MGRFKVRARIRVTNWSCQAYFQKDCFNQFLSFLHWTAPQFSDIEEDCVRVLLTILVIENVYSLLTHWRIKILEKPWKGIHLTDRLLDTTFGEECPGTKPRYPECQPCLFAVMKQWILTLQYALQIYLNRSTYLWTVLSGFSSALCITRMIQLCLRQCTPL